MRGLAGLLLLVIGGQSTCASAQSLDAEALRLISETAASICGDFAREGSESEASIEGSAQAKLKGLAGKLVDLGVEGAGNIEDSKYVGVLRAQLGDELHDVRACKLQVWKDLQQTVTSGYQRSGVSTVPETFTYDSPTLKGRSVDACIKSVFYPEPSEVYTPYIGACSSTAQDLAAHAFCTEKGYMYVVDFEADTVVGGSRAIKYVDGSDGTLAHWTPSDTADHVFKRITCSIPQTTF